MDRMIRLDFFHFSLCEKKLSTFFMGITENAHKRKSGVQIKDLYSNAPKTANIVINHLKIVTRRFPTPFLGGVGSLGSPLLGGKLLGGKSLGGSIFPRDSLL